MYLSIVIAVVIMVDIPTEVNINRRAKDAARQFEIPPMALVSKKMNGVIMPNIPTARSTIDCKKIIK